MPKAGKVKFYAVKVGREGPMVYNTWDECKANVSRWPGAVHKSFLSRESAEEWLNATQPRSSAPAVTDRLPPENTHSSRPQSYHPQLESTVKNNHLHRSSPSDAEDFIPVPGPQVTVKLSSEQATVLEMVRKGRNVFFTGSAGTGKSVLLREIIRTLRDSRSEIAVTASTGIASVNIGGTTLHSWAGIGLGQEPAKKLAGKFLRQDMFKPVRERWCEVETLIIDEISMIDGALFDKLEYIGRALRRNEAPFGGIQLVLSGDFCQLPPVPNRVDGVQLESTFAFEAKSWDQCVGRPITLTQVFRQKDQGFVDMLNAMRFGKLDQNTIHEFKKLSRLVVYNDGIEPTELFSTRREVDNANRTRLNQLPHEAYTFVSEDYPGLDSREKKVSLEQMDRLLERLVAMKYLTLKVGAQVMLIKNLVQGELVNGSVGKVVAFNTPHEAMKNHTDVAKADDPRGSSVVQKPMYRDRRWPVVKFTDGRIVLCVPAEFTVNNAQGGMEARRDQVPLILAWALSVHKSQGQTIERVKVDLGSTFEKGQAYVALSRATGLETLQVLRFTPSKVMAHPRVLAWYANQEKSGYFGENDEEMDTEEALSAFYEN